MESRDDKIGYKYDTNTICLSDTIDKFGGYGYHNMKVTQ